MDSFENENNKKYNENITLINCIKNNLLTWIIIFICITIISYPNIINGYFTFIILMLMAYFVHLLSHKYCNFFTKIHKYHHEHNDYFSYISQIFIELFFGLFFLNLHSLILFEPSIIILFTLFYTTIHNINYGLLRVNDVHYLHHKNMFTNIGPDICDVIFNTKNNKNLYVEDISHYIPNIILITILILIFKYFFYNFKNLKSYCIYLLSLSIYLIGGFLLISSIILYFIK